MIKKLFPTSLYVEPLCARGLRLILRDLEMECRRLAEVDHVGRDWSERNYPGGYTSYGSMDRLHEFSSTFGELRDLLDGHVARFAKHLDMDIPASQLHMTTCWANVMGEANTHSSHIHPLSAISGTFYVKTPRHGGALKLEDPRLGFFMASPPRKLRAREDNQRFHLHRPKPGEVVLFESWTRHEVPPNRDEQERISISFNYDWIPR